MLVIDLIVGGVIVASAIYGWFVGLDRALPVAGFAAGAVLGSRLPLLLGHDLHSSSALVIALPAALIVGGIFGALAERLTPSAARLVGRVPLLGGVAGALLVGASAVVAAWALAPAAAQIPSVRDDVQRSEVLARFNAVLAPTGPVGRKRSRTSDRSQSARHRPPTFRARGFLTIPAVRRAERSIVKIVISRCNGGFQGSGWITDGGFVVTNAHVVTTAKKIFVMRRGKGLSLPATVVWFDGVHDLALLRVSLLGSAPGLPLVKHPRPGTPGFSLGFESGRETIRRAKLGITTPNLMLPTEKLDNVAGVSLTMENRLVTIIRGLNGPGGSGGPMIDRHGRVLATVFGGIPTAAAARRGGFTLAVPNRIVRSALGRAGRPVRVPACGGHPLSMG